MVILSLFDGISGGQIALNRANIKYSKYYASEIDKYAIKITQANYPDTVQLGSITEWQSWNIDQPDLIIGGSPCQGFSFAGKQLNFDDPRSKLFFTFVDILKHFKPKYFLLENVIMKAEYNDVISSILGEIYPECITQQEFFRAGRLEPIEINSALVSAQNRRRLYWTNIPGITQPADKGILLKDIIEGTTTEKDKSFCIDANYFKGSSVENYQDKSRRQLVMADFVDRDKSYSINASYATGSNLEQYTKRHRRQIVFGGAIRGRSKDNPSDRTPGIELEQRLEINQTGKPNALTTVSKDSLCILTGRADIKDNDSIKRVYSGEGKSPTLNAASGGNLEPKIIVHNLQPRNGKGIGGKGHLQKEDGKSYCLDTGNGQAIELNNSITWRKLTPVECERLQTVPDNYTNHVSNSRRYHALGNGWTVDVIVHIFNHIKE